MPRQKMWWFTVSDCNIYVMCANTRSGANAKRLERTNGQPYGAVKKLAVYTWPSSSDRPGPSTGPVPPMEDNKTDLKIIFYEGNPRVLHRSHFLWQINSFCRRLKPAAGVPCPSTHIVDEFNKAILNLHVGAHQSDASDSDENETCLSPNALEGVNVSTSSEPESVENRMEATDGCESQKKPNKRKHSDIEVPLLMKKRLHVAEITSTELYKSEAANAFLGHVKISIHNLELGEQIRPVRMEFVASLQQQMEKFSNSTYQPLCVITKTLQRKDQFTEANANGYKYVIIGGQHNFLAAKSISQIHPKNELFKTRWCSVFHGGSLSPEGRLFLANGHNVIGAYRHKMTFKDKVKICNSIKKEAAGKRSSNWKKTCCSILGEDFSSHSAKSMLFLADQDDKTFSLVLQALQKHEMGELKGQRIKKKEAVTGVPEIRPYVFRPFQTLPCSAFQELLQELLNCQITMAEFKAEGDILNKLQRIQQLIVALTDSPSWEDVKDRFPNHCNREVLFQFISKGKTIGMTQELKQFCRMLKNAESITTEEELFLREAPYKGVAGTVGFSLNKEPTEITAESIKRLSPLFRGFHLTILDMPEEWTEPQIKAFLAAVTAVNVSAELQDFTLATLCLVSRETIVKQCLTETQQFEHVSRCFYHVSNVKPKDDFADSVGGLIVAHRTKPKALQWALSGKRVNLVTCVKDANYQDDDGNDVDPRQKPLGLYREIVHTFSSQHQWVLAACCRTGTGLLACLQGNRNCVAVEKDNNLLFHLQGRWNKQGLGQVGKKNEGRKKVEANGKDADGENDDGEEEDGEEDDGVDDWAFPESLEEELIALTQ